MIFPTLSISLLSLASLAIAAPHLHSRFEHTNVAVRDSDMTARGVTWTRDERNRNRNRNRNNIVTDITITEFQNTVVQDRGRDIQLVSLIQERLIVIDNSRQIRDNIRRNTFRNRRDDQNNNVNVVIIVVTNVIDVRNNNDRRYMTRKLQSNRNGGEQVLIVITESNTMTIGRDDQATRVQELRAQATATPEQKYAIFDPEANAAFVSNSSSDSAQELLPQGASAPRWRNAQESLDPALIIEENPSQQVFVEFVQENGRNNRNGNNNDRNGQDLSVVIAIGS